MPKRAEEYRKAASLRRWRIESDQAETRHHGETGRVPWMAHVADGSHDLAQIERLARVGSKLADAARTDRTQPVFLRP